MNENLHTFLIGVIMKLITLIDDQTDENFDVYFNHRDKHYRLSLKKIKFPIYEKIKTNP